MHVLLLPLVLLAVLISQPAAAHKVITSTYVIGDTIEGEVGFSSGDMAVDTPVMVVTPDGRRLGETKTDGDGFFTFKPREAVDHVFRADMGAGHVAEAVIKAAELPAGLGAGPSAPASMVSEAASVTDAAVLDETAALTPGVREVIAQAVRDEVRPLRRELVAYREQNDLQGILGGIGYIVGLFGVVFYLMARQRLKAA